MSISVSKVFEQLGDSELAVLRALESGVSMDDSRLASAARLSVSTAVAAAHRLHQLELVKVRPEGDHEVFTLDSEALQALRAQVGAAPEAVFG